MRALLRLLADRNRLVLALLLLVGSIGYFTFKDHQGLRGGVATLDGYYYYIYLRSLQVDGDLDFRNEYAEWGNPFKFGATSTGRARNVFGVGPALLWAPFFGVTHGVVALLRACGQPLSLDGLSRFHQVGTLYGSMIYGWLAVLFTFLIAARVLGRRHALWATLGAALAGPLPYYCLTGASYSHAAATMATALLTLLWLRFREALDRRRWLWLGAAMGLALLVRPATLPFALLLLVEGWRQVAPSVRRRDLAAALRAAAGPLSGIVAAIVVFSPQLVVWQLLNGSPFTVPQGQGFLWFAENAWVSTLFSPRNGLLPSAPLIAVALAGLVGGCCERGHPARALLAVVLGYALLNGGVHDWWGWNFSARRFTSCLPAFAIGLGVALRWARDRLERRPAHAAAWGTGIVIAGAAVFNLEWMAAFARENLRWYDVRSTQALYMTVTHNLVDRVYRAVGNPLSLPAALPFALQQGTPLRAYDRLDGSYLLGEVNPATNPGVDPLLHAMVDLSSWRYRDNLSAGFGTPVRDAPVRYVPLRTPEGHIFLPLNRPGPLRVQLRARASSPGTRVRIAFNGEPLSTLPLAHGDWSVLDVAVPGARVRRGVNRLELSHQLSAGAGDRGPRVIGRTGARSPVDVAVASGGLRGGRFCEIWVAEQLVGGAETGLNVAVIDRQRGELLGSAGFAVQLHGALYAALAQYLDHFPAGSIVALGVRAQVGKRVPPAARTALARLGASSDLGADPEGGFAAIGILGAPAGTALESVADRQHARVAVGRKPPPWREIARYSAIRLR